MSLIWLNLKEQIGIKQFVQNEITAKIRNINSVSSAVLLSLYVTLSEPTRKSFHTHATSWDNHSVDSYKLAENPKFSLAMLQCCIPSDILFTLHRR